LARAPRNGNVEAAPKADGITTGRNDCAGVPLAWPGAFPEGSTMKKAATILASVAVLAVAALAVPGSAEARTYRHWHHYYSYALYYDYDHGNMLSPASYIYPAANWGPFFYRVRHYGPVLYQPPAY
jgi:hypothetical protein